MTYRELTYMVLDEIKSLGGDSEITEEHVIFLANLYRVYLIKLEQLKNKLLDLTSDTDYLTLCTDLELCNAVEGLDYCNDTYLRTTKAIPQEVEGTSLKIYPTYLFAINVAIVSLERFRFVGHNKYMNNILYVARGEDNHIYFKSNNPLFLYLSSVKIKGIFDDSSEDISDLLCDDNGESCDILDASFPLLTELVPLLIELIVKELLGAEYRPSDDLNNSTDDIADLVAYVRRNMKSDLAKLITL